MMTDSVRHSTTTELPKRAIRVVYVDHTAVLSGGELALMRLLANMHGVSANVILAEDGPLVEALVEQGISVEVIAMRRSVQTFRKGDVGMSPAAIFAGALTLIYALRLARELRRLDADLVHANSLKSGVYAALATRIARVPLVWHLRDRLASDYLPALAIPPLRAFIKLFASGVVCDSQTTLATLRVSGARRPIAVIAPSAVAHAPRAVNRLPHPLRFGIVGRLTRWKGQDVFLRAFAIAFPTGGAEAVVVGAPLFGEDDELYAQELTELARSLGIVDRVDFKGHRHDIQTELSELDVLVHASTTPEPFGQVILEGMAAGLPVIASDGGGPSEILRDGVEGILYPPGDVDVLAKVLGMLAKSPRERERLGLAAARRALDFSPEVSADAIGDLYSELTRGTVASAD